MNNPKLKNIVEGFIFASDKALSVDKILKMFPEMERPEKQRIIDSIEELQSDFESHGVELKKISSGYRFQVREEFTQWVSRLWEERPQKYTRALLETLALIVYRQPITRGEIEEIRGVSVSSNIVRTLQEREWVKVVGNRDVPGRPALLASTKEFLDYFNLESLEDLPPLSEIKDLDAIATELDPEQNAALIAAIRDMQETQKSSEDGADTEQSKTDQADTVQTETEQEKINSELGDIEKTTSEPLNIEENTPELDKTLDDGGEIISNEISSSELDSDVNPKNKKTDSVEDIAAEIEKAIEASVVIDAIEESMEAELIEQTEHEQTFLQESEDQSELSTDNKTSEKQIPEPSTEN